MIEMKELWESEQLVDEIEDWKVDDERADWDMGEDWLRWVVTV